MNFVYRHHVLSIVIKEGSGITLKKGIFYILVKILCIELILMFYVWGGRGGRDRMVVGFTTTYAISAFHH